jgi:hypothetical protein
LLTGDIIESVGEFGGLLIKLLWLLELLVELTLVGVQSLLSELCSFCRSSSISCGLIDWNEGLFKRFWELSEIRRNSRRIP